MLGDYVKYQGNGSIIQEPLHSPDVARIDGVEKPFNEDRAYLFLLTKQQYIWSSFQNIRPIFTTDQWLKRIGFEEVKRDGYIKYTFANINVSESIINVLDKNQTISTGFCIADFTKGINNIQQFSTKDGFDLENFFKTYQSVQNLNDLFTYLRQHNIAVNPERILIEGNKAFI
ncbi:MAG TPA: hypothetical protein VHB70_18220 [Parafilimonas sp.]|nr:hypothetical protein [Parafilimonas sp.]